MNSSPRPPACASSSRLPICDSPTRNILQNGHLDYRKKHKHEELLYYNNDDDHPSSNKRCKSSHRAPTSLTFANTLDSIQQYLMDAIQTMWESFPYCKSEADKQSTYCYNRVRQRLEFIKKSMIRFAYRLSSLQPIDGDAEAELSAKDPIDFINYFNWACVTVSERLPTFDEPQNMEFKAEIYQALVRLFVDVLERTRDRDLTPRNGQVLMESQKVIKEMMTVHDALFAPALKVLAKKSSFR